MRAFIKILVAIVLFSLPVEMLSASSPCVFGWKTYTCSQLGMVADDYESRAQNTKILIRAINAGYKIVCDNTYFLGRNHGDILNNVFIVGEGRFILDGSLTITHEIHSIELTGVTFMSYDIFIGTQFDANSPACVFLFANNDDHYELNEVAVRNCKINNISLIRFQNRKGDRIKKVLIEGNEWRNMSYVGVGMNSTRIMLLTIADNKAYKIKSRLFDFATVSEDKVNKLSIVGNYLTNEGYISNTEEFYAGFAVVECIDAVCKYNTMENFLVANEKVNLYDIYCNCQNLVFTNNRKLNVLNFRDVNILCKAKSFFGTGGSRLVEDNTYIVEEAVINKHKSLLTDQCSIRLISLSPNEDNQQASLVVRNNYIEAPIPCSFGMSSNTNIKTVHIENNRIVCQSVSEGDYYYRGIADDVYLTGNTISATDKVTTNTPAVSLLKGRYKMDNCAISAFPGAISKNVENNVSKTNLTFAYSANSSPNIAIGGAVIDCSIDFQNYDRANNYNIYLERAKNTLNISRLTVNNPPRRGTLWLRNILDDEHSADFIELNISYGQEYSILFIDNIHHRVSFNEKSYTIDDSLPTIIKNANGQSYINITLVEDKLGIKGLKEGMQLSIMEINESQYNNKTKKN